MTTLGSPVYAGSSNLPLWVSTAATSITITDSNQAGSVTLTESSNQLLVNGVPLGGPPTQWSLYPAISNTVKMDASNFITNITSNLYFAGNLLARYSDIPALSNWSLFPAISNTIRMDASNNITNTGSNLFFAGNQLTTISALSNWSSYAATSAVNFSNFTMSNVSNVFGLNNINISNSGGINIINTADLNITTGNGNRGKLTLTANPGFSNGIQGEVRMVANGGSTSVGGISYATGGLIELTANTPVATSNTFTSAIKLNAASCLSYAGATSPISSLLGYNFVQADNSVQIVSGTVPVLPSIPGTNFLYGSSFPANRISNGLATDTIRNISPSGNLLITTNAYPNLVNISNVGTVAGMVDLITGSNLGLIRQMSNVSTSNIDMTGVLNGFTTGTLCNIANITTTNINVTTINSNAYPPSPSNWSAFPATCNVNMSNYDISNLTKINGNNLYIQAAGFLSSTESLTSGTPYMVVWDRIYTNQMLMSNTDIINQCSNADINVFQLNASFNVKHNGGGSAVANFYVFQVLNGTPEQSKHYYIDSGETLTCEYTVITSLQYAQTLQIEVITDHPNVQLLYESGPNVGGTTIPDVYPATFNLFNLINLPLPSGPVGPPSGTGGTGGTGGSGMSGPPPFGGSGMYGT